MRIVCNHGFFIFEEDALGEVSDFIGLHDLDLSSYKNDFTFKPLKDAADFSIKGADYLNFKAVKTFQGEPWEVMRANGLVYDFQTGKLVDYKTINEVIQFEASSNSFVANGLVSPGSITQSGKRILGFSCWYSRNDSSWLYSGVTYE